MIRGDNSSSNLLNSLLSLVKHIQQKEVLVKCVTKSKRKMMAIVITKGSPGKLSPFLYSLTKKIKSLNYCKICLSLHLQTVRNKEIASKECNNDHSKHTHRKKLTLDTLIRNFFSICWRAASVS